MTGCGRSARHEAALQGRRHHRRRLRAQARAARRRRQAAHAGRLQGQGGGRVLRLHAMPRRLPDHDGRAGRRSSSRSAPTASACRACSSPSTPSATRREVLKAYVDNFDPSFVALRGTPEQTQAAAQGIQGVLRARCRARREAATRSTTPPASSSSTRRAGCGCSCATAAAPKALADDLKRCSPAASRKTSGPARGRRRVATCVRPCRSSALRIFFIAATSIWRMRSALTPYRPPARAASCRPSCRR